MHAVKSLVDDFHFFLDIIIGHSAPQRGNVKVGDGVPHLFSILCVTVVTAVTGVGVIYFLCSHLKIHSAVHPVAVGYPEKRRGIGNFAGVVSH